MTSSASIDNLAPFRIRGQVIATLPPGRDPRPVSGHARLLTCPRAITSWRQETSRG
jgi:hypothetical protein